uniref:Protein BIG GRAIN 1-like E n=1 Tax=Ananas comosus var. bracteatus TaxID=296719 RepID=A0A6V7Q4V6_ANACO|nr:unnamed protein product [Ananas comosus var. bracteatus]
MPTSITTHCRDSSDDELDVFEAARYFSGGFDGLITGRLSFQRTLRQELLFKGDRRSLDMPMKKPKTPSSQEPCKMERNYNEIKSKQPSSPGGSRLASFLISLFHQRSSKKKTTKSPVTTTQSMKDGDLAMIKHGQERRRRKSTSYSQNISGDHNSYSKSMHYSSKSSSGFRTPPPLPCLPKEKVTTSSLGGRVHGSGDHHDHSHNGKSSVREEGFMMKNVGFGRREKEEEAGEGSSDSSSDLFELKNYGMEDFSSGDFPVYGATNAGIISSN